MLHDPDTPVQAEHSDQSNGAWAKQIWKAQNTILIIENIWLYISTKHKLYLRMLSIINCGVCDHWKQNWVMLFSILYSTCSIVFIGILSHKIDRTVTENWHSVKFCNSVVLSCHETRFLCRKCTPLWCTFWVAGSLLHQQSFSLKLHTAPLHVP